MAHYRYSSCTWTVLSVVMVFIQSGFIRANKLYCNRPVDLVFMLDGSESVTPAEFIQQKAFVASQSMVYDIVSGNVRIGILLYGSNVTESLDLGTAKDEHDVVDRVFKLKQPSDGNNVYLGIKQLRSMMKKKARKNAIKAAVIITDGRLRDTIETFREADGVREDGIDMYVIGVGREIRRSELFRLAGGRKHVMRVPDFGSLFKLTQTLRSSLCSGFNKRPLVPEGVVVKPLIGSTSSIWKILIGVNGVPIPKTEASALSDSAEEKLGAILKSIAGDGKGIRAMELANSTKLLTTAATRLSTSKPIFAAASTSSNQTSSSSLFKKFFSADILKMLQTSKSTVGGTKGTYTKLLKDKAKPKPLHSLSASTLKTSIGTQEHSFLVSRQKEKGQKKSSTNPFPKPEKVSTATASGDMQVKIPSLESLLGKELRSQRTSRKGRKRKVKKSRAKPFTKQVNAFKDLFSSFQKSRKDNTELTKPVPENMSTRTLDSRIPSGVKQMASSSQTRTFTPVAKILFQIPGQQEKSVDRVQPKRAQKGPLPSAETPRSTKYEHVFKKMVNIIKAKETPSVSSNKRDSISPVLSTNRTLLNVSPITTRERSGSDFLAFFKEFKSRSRAHKKPSASSVSLWSPLRSSNVQSPSSRHAIDPPTSQQLPTVITGMLQQRNPVGTTFKKQFFSLGDSLDIPLAMVVRPETVAEVVDTVIEVVGDAVENVPAAWEHITDTTSDIIESTVDLIDLAVDVVSEQKEIFEKALDNNPTVGEFMDAAEDVTVMTELTVDKLTKLVGDIKDLVSDLDIEIPSLSDLKDQLQVVDIDYPTLLEPVDIEHMAELQYNVGQRLIGTSGSSRVADLGTDIGEAVFEAVGEGMQETVETALDTATGTVSDAVETMMEYFEENDALNRESNFMMLDSSMRNEEYPLPVNIQSGPLFGVDTVTSQAPQVQYLTFSVTGTRPYQKTNLGTVNVKVKDEGKNKRPLAPAAMLTATQSTTQVTQTPGTLGADIKITRLDSLVDSLSKRGQEGTTRSVTSTPDSTSGNYDGVSSRWKVRLSKIMKDRLDVLKHKGSKFTYTHSTITKKPTASCRETPVGPEGEFYIQVIGNTSVTRPCPIGTRFDTTLCRCNVRLPEELYIGCTSELRLTFDTSFSDESGKSAAVGDENVFLQDGAARFDGTGKLTVWRFSSAYVGPELSIRFRVKPSSSTTSTRQYLLGNCAPGQPMTYGIQLDVMRKVMTFVVTTDVRNKTSVEVPYIADSWNEVELRYGGLQLTGSVNSMSSSVPLGGQVRSTGAPLSIGKCDDTLSSFKGLLDDVSIHFCNPGWETRAALFKRRHVRT